MHDDVIIMHNGQLCMHNGVMYILTQISHPIGGEHCEYKVMLAGCIAIHEHYVRARLRAKVLIDIPEA